MVNERQIISCCAEPEEPFVCGELATCTLVIRVAEDISADGRIRFHFTESPYYRSPPNYGLPAKGFVFFARLHFQTDKPQEMGYITAGDRVRTICRNRVGAGTLFLHDSLRTRANRRGRACC